MLGELISSANVTHECWFVAYRLQEEIKSKNAGDTFVNDRPTLGVLIIAGIRARLINRVEARMMPTPTPSVWFSKSTNVPTVFRQSHR